MRKFKLLSIILLIVLVVGLVGCSKKKPTGSNTETGAEGWPTEAKLTEWKLVGFTQPAGVTNPSWYELRDEEEEELTINFTGTDETDAAIREYPKALIDYSNGWFLFPEDILESEESIQILFSTDGGSEEAWYMRNKTTGQASLSVYRELY